MTESEGTDETLHRRVGAFAFPHRPGFIVRLQILKLAYAGHIETHGGEFIPPPFHFWSFTERTVDARHDLGLDITLGEVLWLKTECRALLLLVYELKGIDFVEVAHLARLLLDVIVESVVENVQPRGVPLLVGKPSRPLLDCGQMVAVARLVNGALGRANPGEQIAHGAAKV